MSAAGMDRLRIVSQRRTAHRHLDPARAGREPGSPGADICVVNHEEVGGYTYARFARNGTPWPNEDWGVDVDSFCFYKK